MTRNDINEAVVVRQGLASIALQDGASEGDVPAVNADGQVEFAAPEGGPGQSLPIQTGSGSPLDVVTPTATGYIYIDEDLGGIYQAFGPTNADWIQIGMTPDSGNIGSAAGLILRGDKSVYILAGNRDAIVPGGRQVVIGDAYSFWNGHQQGLYWDSGSAEGQESLTFRIGETGSIQGTLIKSDGGIDIPGAVEAAGIQAGSVGVVAVEDAPGLFQVYNMGMESIIRVDNDGSVVFGAGVDKIKAATGFALDLCNDSEAHKVVIDDNGIQIRNGGSGSIAVGDSNDSLGFFAATPAGRPNATTDPASIHAALVALGLIGDGGVGGGMLHAIIREQQNSGVAPAGSPTADTWNTRLLNTEVLDPNSIVSLASNQFTLGAGTYLIRAGCYALGTDQSKARIRNITNSATLVVGANTHATVDAGIWTPCEGWFTVAGTTVCELQHFTHLGGSTYMWGEAASSGEVEVYSEVHIFKVS